MAEETTAVEKETPAKVPAKVPVEAPAKESKEAKGAPDKRLVILSARGDHGYDPGGRLASMNLVESGLRVPLGYIGLTDSHAIAIEYDEFADERLAASIAEAEQAADRLVDDLTSNYS